jgi:hypothetical protein
MHFRSTSLAALALMLAASPAFALHHHRAATLTSHKHSGRGHHKLVKAHWTPGQRGIDSDRTRAIQTALISRNYMTGQASGDWDADTEAAMQKYQGDNGWQTKLMPDSRALIKLGLGPDGDDGVAIAPGSGASVAAGGALQPATGADSLASIHSIQN